MPQSIKISIIMPTYNRAGLILQTIESIRNQSYRNWELFIMDDGSTDNTEELILGLSDERIHYDKLIKTGIGGKIKNAGLEKASGEFIAFIDSDDLWEPTKLQKQAAALQEYPSAGFCVTNGYNFRTPGQAIDFFYQRKEGMRQGDFFVEYFKSGLAAFTQALLFRKNCLRVTGNFKEVKSFSDIDFIITLARHFTGVILYEPLVYRRLHAENYIDANWEKSYYEGISIIDEYRRALPANVVRDALFRLYINFGEKCLKQREKAKATSNFLKAWKKRPISLVPLKKIFKVVLFSPSK